MRRTNDRERCPRCKQLHTNTIDGRRCDLVSLVGSVVYVRPWCDQQFSRDGGTSGEVQRDGGTIRINGRRLSPRRVVRVSKPKSGRATVYLWGSR